MKHIVSFFLILLIISTILPLAALSEQNIEFIDQLSSLEENQIDIGRVCLWFAKEAYPDLDVEKYSKKLDQMVKEIQRLTGNSIDPDQRIRALNTYLYKRQGFHYDRDDPYARKLKNRYINGLLDTKSGSCVTMPLLYLALAQRLGYPVYSVSAPQHLFLRYVDPNLEMQNIEATSGGGYSSDADYIVAMEIPNRGIDTGAYLQTMTYKEVLAELFAENTTYWIRNHDYPKAVHYLEQSLRLNPRNAEVYRIYGNLQLDLVKSHRVIQVSDNLMVKIVEENRQLQKRNQLISKGQELLRKADELGAAPPTPKNYWLIQEEKRNEHKLSKEVNP